MLTIDPHHNGPPASGHGGVAAGRMAELVDPERAVVRFAAPIPLGQPLVGVPTADGATEVRAGSTTIAAVRPTSGLEVTPFRLLGPSAVLAAEDSWLDFLGGAHPFPTCFACGDQRQADGLGLRPGRVPGTTDHATFWTPAIDGTVPAWLVWAALDCPTGVPALAEVGPGRVVVTGQLAVDIRRPLRGQHRHQILSRVVEGSGRKFLTEAAILDGDGQVVAVAAATWISIAAEVMGAA